jgi:hypothetical protein
MRAAPRLNIEAASLAERVDFLLADYSYLLADHGHLLALLSRLEKYAGAPTVASWCQRLEAADYKGLVASLIAYYDSCYKRPSDTLVR